MADSTSVFKTVFASTPLNDGLYFFLQDVYRHYPEDEFHLLLAMATKDKDTDEEIYREARGKLAEIKPFMAKFTYVLPALRKLKKHMRAHTLQLLSGKTAINGCLEIGTAGGFTQALKSNIKLKGHRYIMTEGLPLKGLAGIIERGSLLKPRHLHLTYTPESFNAIPDESLDLVLCYNGLHHCPPDILPVFLAAIKKTLRKGGVFILREHNVQTEQQHMLVTFAHTVINLGGGLSWAANNEMKINLKPVAEWVVVIEAAGFEDSGARLVVGKDPVYNTLMAFVKE